LVKAFQALESKLSPLSKLLPTLLNPLLVSLLYFIIHYLLGRREDRKTPDLSLIRSPSIATNVRRYVALAQSRGGACFCTRGAMQGYAVITLFSRWQKP